MGRSRCSRESGAVVACVTGKVVEPQMDGRAARASAVGATSASPSIAFYRARPAAGGDAVGAGRLRLSLFLEECFPALVDFIRSPEGSNSTSFDG
jgi:hypothetical protein